MTNPERIKQILLSEIEKMDQHHEDFCKDPETDFTRDRKIPFDTLLHFQISMESGSVNHELLKYFNFDARTPSLSAFYATWSRMKCGGLTAARTIMLLSPSAPESCSKAGTNSLHVMGQALPVQGIRRTPKAITIPAGAPQKAIIDVPRPVV